MSLCMVVRTPDGGTLMAADTALSTVVGGQKYRLSDLEDDEKIIEHNGALIFCSGSYEKCKDIRKYIKEMARLNLVKVSEYAQQIFGHDTSDDSSGILVCWEDGSMVGMLSAQDFNLTPIPWNRDGVDFFALGFHMKETYDLFAKHAQTFDHAKDILGNIYHDLLCEEVGGHLWMYSRKAANEPWEHVNGTFVEPESIKKIQAKVARPSFQFDLSDSVSAHGIVQAKDFLLGNGTSVKSALTDDKTKIRGEYIDARGINILDDGGHQVLYIDATGIHWTPKYNPFKTQYSVGENGPWHDTYAKNDEYRRDSTDGGITWSAGIKYVAKDGVNGTNGSDATVNYNNIKSALEKAASIPTAFMSVNEMGAPEIFGGKIYGAEIYAGGVGKKGGQVIGLTDKGIQIYDGVGSKVLKIQGLNGGANLTTGDNPLHLSSPNLSFGDIGYIGFSGQKADFTEMDEVDFTGVKTTGLHATFG